jgi:hypothetical protein
LLRYLLVEAAQTAVGRDEELKRFYLRLLRRRGAQKAKVAAARKLLIRGYILLRDGIDYAEFLRPRRRSTACPACNIGIRCLGFVIGRPASPA